MMPLFCPQKRVTTIFLQFLSRSDTGHILIVTLIHPHIGQMVVQIPTMLDYVILLLLLTVFLILFEYLLPKELL